MNPAAVIALLGLIAAVTWGIADFFAAKSAKSIGPVTAAVIVNCISAVAFTAIVLVFLNPHFDLTWVNIGLAAGSGAVFSIGLAAFFIGLSIGPVSVVSPLSSMYPLITTSLAIVLFHAVLTPRELIGIVLIVLGVLAASGLFTADRAIRRLAKGPAFALAAAFFWGIAFALLAQAIKRMGWQAASVFEVSVASIGLFALLPIIKGAESFDRKTIVAGFKNKFVVGSALFGIIGLFAINIGLSRSITTGGAIVTAISACYPILTIFLALRYLKEKVHFFRLAGAVVGISGVVLLSVG